MIVPVKFLVNHRAFQPEIRAQIDHLATRLQQRPRKFRRHPMGQGQENHLRRFSQRLRLGFGELQTFRQRRSFAYRGKIWPSVLPAYCREVTAANSACGCSSSRRVNSSPE